MIKHVLPGILCILAGCSQKQEPKDAYESLKNGKWVLSGCIVKPLVNGKDSNVFEMYPVCMKDDTLAFREDGKLVRHNAFTGCQPEEKTEVYSLWKEKDKNSFYIDSTLNTIRSISDQQVVLESSQKIHSVTYSFIATYSNRAK